MHLEQVPPPAPARRPAPAGLALVALALGIVALLLALPILWWRISAQPDAVTLAGEVVQAISGEAGALPSWYSAVRASAMLAAFLALLLAVIALILKHSGRLAGIAVVLALASFAATSSSLLLMIVGGVLLLAVLMLAVGVG